MILLVFLSVYYVFISYQHNRHLDKTHNCIYWCLKNNPITLQAQIWLFTYSFLLIWNFRKLLFFYYCYSWDLHNDCLNVHRGGTLCAIWKAIVDLREKQTSWHMSPWSCHPHQNSWKRRCCTLSQCLFTNVKLLHNPMYSMSCYLTKPLTWVCGKDMR